MSHWWRAHDEAVDDPKLCLLSDRLHRAWFNLMCVASAYGGVLPDIKIVAVKLRMSASKAQAAVDALREARLIDETESGLRPHNWDARQFKSDVTDPTNAERQQRYRDRHRNAVTTVTEIVTVTPTREQSTETEKKDAASAAPEVDFYRRGKEVLGQNSGGLLRQLLSAKKGSVPEARAVVEMASTKQDPREYVGAIVRGKRGTHAEQFKLIDQIREQKRSAVVFADEVPGGIPGIE